MKKTLIHIVLALSTLGLSPSPATGQSAAPNPGTIRRTPDGKPDFPGVWAGPAFRHRVGPDD